MSRFTRTLALGVSALAVVAMATAVNATARTTPARTTATGSAPVTLGASTITWGACGAATGLAGIADVQCGFVTVPLDYSKPNGATIQLAVSRVQHTVPAAQFQGVMLTNPGGPGGSGLSLSTIGQYVANGVGNDYDWIGFDPRGVGSSLPAVSCDPDYFGFARPNYIPVQQSDLSAWLNRTKQYDADCAANNGPILDHSTTVDSAKDMDSIRIALGASQINYYGYSYGTYLGQVYSTLFPSHVRKMVLDSNVDPTKIWSQANFDQDVAFQRNMGIWFTWLAKYNSVYHLGATEKAVETRFDRIQARLTLNPAGGKIGGDEWVDTFIYAGYYQEYWEYLAQLFSAYVNDNDLADLESAYLSFAGYGDDNEFAMYNATQCTDVQWPTNVNQVVAANWAVFTKAPFETWSNAWFNAPCLYWPAPAQSSTPMKIGSSAVAPFLLIDQTLDAATPYEGSLEVRSLYPGARLLALPGGTTHADSTGNGDACEDGVIAAYLGAGTLPARAAGSGPDATCAPNPQPDPATDGSASASATAQAHSASRALSAVRALPGAVPGRPTVGLAG